MSKADAYFQFPIAILKDFNNTHDVCAVITHYSLWHVGHSLYESSGVDGIAAIADEYLQAGTPVEYKENNASQNIVLAAAARLHVPIRNIAKAAKNAFDVHCTYGIDGTQCRIRADIVSSAMKQSWPVLRLKVLCAVLAGIGSGQHRRMTRMTNRMIRALGAGYNSPRDLAEADLLADTTTRRHVDDLWCSNFFQRCSDGRDFWYSLSFATDKELAAAVKRKLREKKSKLRVDINDI